MGDTRRQRNKLKWRKKTEKQSENEKMEIDHRRKTKLYKVMDIRLEEKKVYGKEEKKEEYKK